MTLAVIGSGFGRTGTNTLKYALEALGFGRCHHMEEVFADPSQAPFWQAVAAGEAVDWRAVFAGFGAQVDWPGAHVWRELAEAFPEAKVIHTTRPEAAWWKSFSATIGPMMATRGDLPMPPHVQTMVRVAHTLVAERTFGAEILDRDAALAAFRRRETEVRAAIPPERLLVYDVSEGWAPLCRFLGVAVPDGPMPHRNSTADFEKMVADALGRA